MPSEAQSILPVSWVLPRLYHCLWGPTANPTLWGLEFIPLLPQRSNSSGNSGLTCDILFSRRVSSQSLRCAVLFIVKIPQSIREPAALPVQVMFKKGKPMGFVVQHSAVEVAESCQQRIISLPSPHWTSLYICARNELGEEAPSSGSIRRALVCPAWVELCAVGLGLRNPQAQRPAFHSGPQVVLTLEGQTMALPAFRMFFTVS